MWAGLATLTPCFLWLSTPQTMLLLTCQPYCMPGAQGARYSDPSIWEAEEKHCEFVVSLDYIATSCFKDEQRRGLCNLSVPLSLIFLNKVTLLTFHLRNLFGNKGVLLLILFHSGISDNLHLAICHPTESNSKCSN